MPEVRRDVRSEMLAQQGERSNRRHAYDREGNRDRTSVRTD
jgi:hypothetical protein